MLADRLFRFQLFGQTGKPARMGEIAGGNQVNAFNNSPGCQSVQVAGFAGRAGVMGVAVKVGAVRHDAG